MSARCPRKGRAEKPRGSSCQRASKILTGIAPHPFLLFHNPQVAPVRSYREVPIHLGPLASQCSTSCSPPSSSTHALLLLTYGDAQLLAATSTLLFNTHSSPDKLSRHTSVDSWVPPCLTRCFTVMGPTIPTRTCEKPACQHC